MAISHRVFDLGLAYSTMASRLRDRVVGLGIMSPVPDSAVFHEAIISFFDEPCAVFEYLLSRRIKPKDWFVVEYSDAACEMFGNLWSEHYVAASERDAVADLLGHSLCADDEMVVITSIRRDEDGALVVFAGQVMLARIVPISLSTEPAVLAERCAGAMKGLRNHGDEGRLYSRLTKIPGLHGLVRPREFVADVGPILHRTPQNLCGQVRKMMASAFDVEVSRGTAQELTAGMFGHPSWNHLVATARAGISITPPTAVIDYSGALPLVRWYSDHGEAIAGFARMVNESGRSGPVEVSASLSFDGVSLVHGSCYEPPATFHHGDLCLTQTKMCGEFGDLYLDEADRILRYLDSAGRLLMHFYQGNGATDHQVSGEPLVTGLNAVAQQCREAFLALRRAIERHGHRYGVSCAYGVFGAFGEFTFRLAESGYEFDVSLGFDAARSSWAIMGATVGGPSRRRVVAWFKRVGEEVVLEVPSTPVNGGRSVIDLVRPTEDAIPFLAASLRGQPVIG